MVKRSLFSYLLSSVCLFACISCSGNEAIDDDGDDQKIPVPAEYKLVSIDFVPDSENNFIPVKGNEEILMLQNPSNILISKTYKPELVPVDTSLFYAPDTPLPQGSNINDIMTGIPDIDCTPIIHGKTIFKFPFSFGKTQTYSHHIDWVEQIANISPKSWVKITNREDGYHVKATYTAILENVHNGERLTLKGRWEGSLLVSGYTRFDEIK